MESWEHMNEVGKRLMKDPDIKDTMIPVKDRVYLVARLAVVLKYFLEPSVGILSDLFWLDKAS